MPPAGVVKVKGWQPRTPPGQHAHQSATGQVVRNQTFVDVGKTDAVQRCGNNQGAIIQYDRAADLDGDRVCPLSEGLRIRRSVREAAADAAMAKQILRRRWFRPLRELAGRAHDRETKRRA